MSYVKVKVLEIGTKDDLKYWEAQMLQKGKCWNKFCIGGYTKEELVGVHVCVEDKPEERYLVPLCTECCRTNDLNDVLVNKDHLLINK